MAIFITLQVTKSAVFRLLFHQLFSPRRKPRKELSKRQFGHISAWEHLFEELLTPLLVARADCRMPAVDEVELHRALIADSQWEGPGGKIVGKGLAGVQCPGRIGGIVHVQDRSHVVSEDDVDIHSARDTVEKSADHNTSG